MFEKKYLKEKLEELNNIAGKRNFKQTYDCIVVLKNLDLRKPDHTMDKAVLIKTSPRNKPLKVAAFVDMSVKDAAEVYDKVFYREDIQKCKGNMKELRKVIHGFDKFVVLSNLMAEFAQVFGRYLGPMGKMPNPRHGMVLTPQSNAKKIYEDLQKKVFITVKKSLNFQFSFGSENENVDDVVDNLHVVLTTLFDALPLHKDNIKHVFVKKTMSKVVRV